MLGWDFLVLEKNYNKYPCKNNNKYEKNIGEWLLDSEIYRTPVLMLILRQLQELNLRKKLGLDVCWVFVFGGMEG